MNRAETRNVKIGILISNNSFNKNENKYEGITISRKFESKYSKRIGFKIIDTIDEYSEKNHARIMRYLDD